jgi:hypothetical protein
MNKDRNEQEVDQMTTIFSAQTVQTTYNSKNQKVILQKHLRRITLIKQPTNKTIFKKVHPK